MQYVVVMREHREVFGPFDIATEAERFAKFMTEEVDPCDVQVLCPPHLELLNWRDRVPLRLADPWGEGPLTVEPGTDMAVRITRNGKVLSRVNPRIAFALARDLVAAAISTEEEPPF